jgi:pimeloyl-ACP methyl ester carboxylesterase
VEEQRTVATVDGLSLVATATGTDAGPVVLAVHGFASTARDNWMAAGWPRALEPLGCRLITFDLRGHGASDSPHDPASYSSSLLRADALAVLDSFGVARAHWLGYSLGARLGLEVARDAPDRVVSLSLGGLPSKDPLAAFDIAAARLQFDTSADIADPVTADLVSAMGAPGRDPLALFAFVEGLRAEPSAAIDGVDQPTLLVTGDADAIANDPASLAARLGAELVMLPGRTHSNAVSARLFKESVVAFIERVGP